MKQSLQTNIDFSLVTKYTIIGLLIVLILSVVVLIGVEAMHISADSVMRITCYSLFIGLGVIMIRGISRLLDPERKNKEREELYASIHQSINKQKNKV